MIQSKGVKNLSATSIKKIRRMIAAVLAEPEFYDQETFGRNICKDDGGPVCGTVCCAAGWAIWLDNRELYDHMIKREVKYGYSFGTWAQRAKKALDINVADVSYRLFATSDSWPKPFNDDYLDAETPKAKAKVFAKRWEHFIKTDGRE